MAGPEKKVDVTTGVGTLSFPRVFKETAGKNDRGEVVYDVQILLPKSDKAGIKKLLDAMREVGEAKWGDKWKAVNKPLRDGDKEKDDLTKDGSTKGEKYPERLGCYFINARSTRPVGVYGRDLTPIVEPDEVYGGCKGKVSVTFYPYAREGNFGIGAGLNGVQKISDGDALGGGGTPAVEAMFEAVDGDDDDLYEDEEVEEAPAPKRRPAKKAATKKKKKAEPAPVEDDEDDLYEDDEDIDDDI